MLDGARAELCRKSARRVEAAFLVSNLFGAVFVFTFLTYIAPNGRVDGGNSALVEVGVFLAYFLVVGVIGGTAGSRVAIGAIGWAMEDRLPVRG